MSRPVDVASGTGVAGVWHPGSAQLGSAARVVLVFLVVVLCLPKTADAQISTMPGSPTECEVDANLSELSSAFDRGDASALNEALRPIAASIAMCTHAKATPALVIWVESNPFGETQLYRVVYPLPRGQEFSLTLPGAEHITQWFLRSQSGQALKAHYVSTMQPDLRGEQVKGVIEAAIPSLLSGVFKASRKGTVTMERATLKALVSPITLPLRRATVAITAKVESARGDCNLPPTLPEGWAAEACHSVVQVVDTVIGQLCGQASWEEPACGDAVRAAVEARLRVLETQAAELGGLYPALLSEIRRRFEADAGAPALKAQWTLTNAPRETWSLGAAAVVPVGSIRSDLPRVTIDGGTYQPDPYASVLWMGTVRIHGPDKPLLRQAALLAGAVVLPDPGLSVGGSIGLVKGVRIAAGYAWTWAPSAHNPGHGNAVTVPEDPYVHKVNRFFFAGVDFDFSKLW